MANPPNMRFNPPPNWPPVPAGWVPPEGWQPEEAWGPPPEGWSLWVSDAKPGWFARHKVLVGVGAGLVGLMLVLGFVGVALSGSNDDSASKPMADAPKQPAAESPADKAPAPDKPAASDDAPAEESTLPEGTDCASVAEEAITASEESGNDVKILKIRSLEILEDNRTSFELPTGPESALVLSCTGLAAGSNGQDGLPVLIKMTVDSDGEYFVAYEDN